MAEWLKAPVSKTGERKFHMGSNPISRAKTLAEWLNATLVKRVALEGPTGSNPVRFFIEGLSERFWVHGVRLENVSIGES